MNNSYLKNQS